MKAHLLSQMTKNPSLLTLMTILCCCLLLQACGPENNSSNATELLPQIASGQTGTTTPNHSNPNFIPSRIQVTTGNQQILLRWNDMVEAEAYNIYWNQSGDFSMVDAEIIHSNSSRFHHLGLTNGATYYYRVTSLSPEGESIMSTMVKAVPASTRPELRQDGI